MNRLRLSLLRYFLPRLLACQCGETVSRSGEEGKRSDCFYVFVDNGDQPDIVLERIDNDQVDVLQFDGERYHIPLTFPVGSIDPRAIRVTHYYGLEQVRYRGVVDLAFGRWTRLPYLLIHLRRLRNAFAQRLFNRRELSLQKRLDVLRDVVEITLRGQSSVDEFSLMTKRFGDRWVGHPDWTAYQQSLRFYLDMLRDSGDLREINGTFTPSGQALKTLDDSDEQDRRHRENIRVQSILAALALLASALAAAQAGLLKFPTILDLTAGTSNISHSQAPQPSTPCASSVTR